MVRRLYPTAKLYKESSKGLADHVNSAKAALLLSDYHLSLLSSSDSKRLISDPYLFKMYLAGAYNAGAGGLVKKIVQSGKSLYYDNPSSENKQYIHKMLAVSQRYS